MHNEFKTTFDEQEFRLVLNIIANIYSILRNGEVKKYLFNPELQDSFVIERTNILSGQFPLHLISKAKLKTLVVILKGADSRYVGILTAYEEDD